MIRPATDSDIRWHPRVPQAKIRRIYENDARGLVDEVLLEDVGIALYLRCQSILLREGNGVACPRCGQTFATGWTWHRRNDGIVIRCPACREWETTGKQYLASFERDALAAGNCLPAFQEFVDPYPRARDARERMRLIDRLIHQFHYARRQAPDGQWKQSDSPHAANGCNLIEGSHDEVVAFLEALTYGDGNAAPIRETREAWRREVARMRTVRAPSRRDPEESSVGTPK